MSFADTLYEKVLIDLQSSMRGKSCDDQNNLIQLRVLADIITDIRVLYLIKGIRSIHKN